MAYGFPLNPAQFDRNPVSALVDHPVVQLATEL